MLPICNSPHLSISRAQIHHQIPPSLLPLTLQALGRPEFHQSRCGRSPVLVYPQWMEKVPSCWMTDDGWVNWAQLGSTGLNLQKPNS